MKKIEKFQVAPGYMLLVRKTTEGVYVMTWSHKSDIALGRNWPGINSSKLHLAIWDIKYVEALIEDLCWMFGLRRINLTADYPAMALVVEFI